MAKMIGVIITLLLLNTGMFIFTFSGDDSADCAPNCDLQDFNTEVNSTVWDYFTNPSQQSKGSFWSILFSPSTGLLAILTAGGLIVAGAVWVTKDINIAYLSVSGFIIAAAIGTWVRLWGLMAKSSFIFGGKSGGVVVMVCVGVLIAVQIVQTIDWGRGRA